MESRAPASAMHTNHDRDFSKMNGINGGPLLQQEAGAGQRKLAHDTNASKMGLLNGGYDEAMDVDKQKKPDQAPATGLAKLEELPLEIRQIADNFIPLGQFLTRLSQRSHNVLQDRIMELAKRRLPAPAVNGHSEGQNEVDDKSLENLEKKKFLLNFVQEEHSNWVKALVVAEWSKNAPQVSMLIDIRNRLHEELMIYHESLRLLYELKRDLTFARLPSPDFKTALQVLSHGTAPWSPDAGYVEPDPMTPEEQLKRIENINTLLSLRLTLEEHDKIPYHFKRYSIQSGRVTFTVDNEFEVDLTVADEDTEKQMWFIDFRFLFSPSTSDLSDVLRAFLENQVNEVLGREGLAGCYNFLHEFVLTHKINEIRRQALQLARGRWVDTLKVERLNRALAIQYWTNRNSASTLKSWIIIGVHSGKRPNAAPHPKFTSCLNLRWFRDNKEVLDVDIPLNGGQISAEQILKTIIARHIEHILSTIHLKLKARTRFAERQASLCLHFSRDEPMESFLEVQLTHLGGLITKIDPITGQFCMEPHSRVVTAGEQRLNASIKDPAEEGVAAIDWIRCHHALEELTRRGKSAGWSPTRNSVKPDEVRQLLRTRENYQTAWLTRQDWDPSWQVMVTLSLSGDRWWLVELSNNQNNQSGPRIKAYIELPLSSGQPKLDDTFFSNFTTFTAGIISQVTDLRELKGQKRKHALSAFSNPYFPPQVKIPALNIKLSEILPSQSTTNKSRKPWAVDFVRILFKGVESARRGGEGSNGDAATQSRPTLGVVAEARLFVTDRTKFSLLKGKVDHDVAFNARTGEFALYLRAEVGKSVIDTLSSRLGTIERLVGFLDAIRRQRQNVRCEAVTLRRLVFTYGDAGQAAVANDLAAAVQQPKRWRVTLDIVSGKEIKVALEKGSPHLRVLDYLTTIANDPVVFEALPFFIAMTLPLQRGLDKMEDAWTTIQRNNAGNFQIFPKAIEWFTIRFTLPSGSPTAPRQLSLDIKLRPRKEQSYWHIFRTNTGAGRSASTSSAVLEDEFDTALKKVWDTRGRNWKGLNTAAVASPPMGIEECLQAIDDAIRPIAENPLQVKPFPVPQSMRNQAKPHKQAQVGKEPAVVDLT